MSDVVILVSVLGASALSVALIVALNAWLGGWSPARLSSIDDAAGAIAEQVLGFEPSQDAVLARGGRAALIVEAGGARLGLVTTAGDRTIVRALRPGEIRSAGREGTVLTLILDDYTFPKAWLELDDEETAGRWTRVAERYAAAQPDADRAQTGPAATERPEHA
ncbi:MAG: hypothetical protein ACOC0V_04890 [Oceanicaulis sp.]